MLEHQKNIKLVNDTFNICGTCLGKSVGVNGHEGCAKSLDSGRFSESSAVPEDSQGRSSIVGDNGLQSKQRIIDSVEGNDPTDSMNYAHVQLCMENVGSLQGVGAVCQLEPNSSGYQSYESIRSIYDINEKPSELIENTLETLTPNAWNLLLYSFILSFTAFPLGWDIGTTGGMLGYAHFTYNHMSSAELGLTISSFNLGCIFGCLSIAQQMCKLKTLVRISSLVYGIGTLVEILCLRFGPTALWAFILGRGICGVCCGSMCTLGTLYTNDLVTSRYPKRAALLGLWQVHSCILILAGNYILVYLMTIRQMGLNYMWVIEGFKVVHILTLNAIMFLVPESLQYYCRKRDYSNLAAIIAKLYTDGDCVSTKQLQSICDYLIPEQDGRSLLDWIRVIFNDKHHIRDLLICSALMACQQLTGINYFFYFGSIIFNSPYALVALSAINLMGLVFYGYVVQKVEPKTLLWTSSVIMGVLMFSFAITSQLSPQKAVVEIMLCCGYIFIFAISWGPCCGLLVSTMTRNNPVIVSVAVAVNWAVNGILSLLTPILIKAILYNVSHIFAVFLWIMALFVWHYIPRIASE